MKRLFTALRVGLGILMASGGSSAIAAPPAVRLEVAAHGVSRWSDSARVGFALELRNSGTRTASNVRVTKISIVDGTLVSKLPIPVGSIASDASTAVQFIADLPQARGDSPVRIEGTYVLKGRRVRFTAGKAVPIESRRPAPIVVKEGVTKRQRPQDARYPAFRPPPVKQGPNSETPILIPPGPPRQIMPPTIKGTELATPGGAISIPVNTSNRNGAATPPDPSAASSGRVALAPYNSGMAFSTDGGASFTDINLFAAVPGQPGRTSFFPQDDGGLCCDQVVIYVPERNLFFWLLQYNPIAGCVANCTPPATPTIGITQSSRLRLAWATPEDIVANFFNAWTYVDLTGPGLGTAANEWLDYPDLGFSGRFLYVGIDHGFTAPGLVYTGRRIVARLSMEDIVSPTATSVGYQFAELTGSNGLNKNHFVQNAPGRMVVASLDNSSTLKIFTWADGAGTIPAPASVAISSISTTYSSPLADGSDWVAVGFPGNITGGTYRRRVQFQAASAEDYMLAFTSGSNGPGRTRPYVRLETLRPNGASGYDVTEEYDIFNPDYAYAMAGLGSGSDLVTPEIGLSLFVGGGTIGYPQGVVGYKNDFVVYQVTGANAAQGSRFGDYVNTRPVPGSTARFATQLYETMLPAGAATGATCATAGCTARMRYIEFERPPGTPPR